MYLYICVCVYEEEKWPGNTLECMNVSLNALDWIARLLKCSKIIVNVTCCHGYADINVFDFNFNALHFVNDLLLSGVDEIFNFFYLTLTFILLRIYFFFEIFF